MSVSGEESLLWARAEAVVSQPRHKDAMEFERRLIAYVRSLVAPECLTIEYHGLSQDDVEISLTAVAGLDRSDKQNLVDVWSDPSSPIRVSEFSSAVRDQRTQPTSRWTFSAQGVGDQSGTRVVPIRMARGGDSLAHLFTALLAASGWSVLISLRPCVDAVESLKELFYSQSHRRPRADELADAIANQGLPLEIRFVIEGPDARLPTQLRSALIALVDGVNLIRCADIDSAWTALPALQARALLRLPWVQRSSFPGVSVVPTQLVKASHDTPMSRAPGLVRLGTVVDQTGRLRDVTITNQDLDRHMYVPGQTGSGKSTFLRGLACELAREGQGLLFIDPHGDTAERLIGELPEQRREDIVFINAADLEAPAPINPFALDSPLQLDTAVENLVEMFHDLFDPTQQGIVGPRWDTWFRMGVWTLIAAHGPKATMLDVPSLFNDEDYLAACKKLVKDPIVLEFWDREMEKTTEQHKSEMLGWFNSKFTAFRMNSVLSSVLGSGRDLLDPTEVMDKSKIVVASLSKGEIGEPVTRLLGYVYLTRFWSAALRRRNASPFTVFVDEAQSFAKGSLPAMLSEGRKFGLRTVMANQYLEQLPKNLQASLLGNVGSIVALRLGNDDADRLGSRFAPEFDPRALRLLPNFQAAASMLSGGKVAPAFSLLVDHEDQLAPSAERVAISEQVRLASREYLKQENDRSAVDVRSERRRLIKEVQDEKADKLAKLRKAQAERMKKFTSSDVDS